MREHREVRNSRSFRLRFTALLCSLILFSLAYTNVDLSLKFWDHSHHHLSLSSHIYSRRAEILDKCLYVKTPAGPPADFKSRTHSDRFVPGTNPILITNAKILTGARNGTEMVFGDLLLHNGLIKAVGYIPPRLLEDAGDNLQVQDAKGMWVTPGLVDLHSHIGVYSSPDLLGASDGNSFKAPILPWLRSIDGLNTHDASYELAMAGGVTTAQILPGSANNIGGQAFVIKLRPTAERSPTSKVIEPPYTLNGSHFDHSKTPRWRHMKHACGENPSSTYSMTRMDTGWNFRQAYDEARKIKEAQDAYCSKAEAGAWDEIGLGSETGAVVEFPESLQWEALVDVLRGKVKLSVHCYEAVDLDGIVRLTNEFKFPVASFHHAGETYLVPDLLKKTWGGVPSIALFASNFRKKREAYRGSEFATRILASRGIPVVMKSDHPVINSRYLLNEASQAYYYGLDAALALASVTSVPANAMGLGHRIGTITEGYDADVVIWDSHPLGLASTPMQVIVDGIPQLPMPAIVSPKPDSFQHLPKTPNWDEEVKRTIEYEGLPPLEPRRLKTGKFVVFDNVARRYAKVSQDGPEGPTVSIQEMFVAKSPSEHQSILVSGTDSKFVCASASPDMDSDCMRRLYIRENDIERVDLKGGTIAPGLTTFGSPLGLVEIRLEPSTTDGVVFDALTGRVPKIVGGDTALIRAVDGLQFGGRNTLLSYRSGVSAAITPPSGRGLILGISTAFAVGAPNALEMGSILEKDVALHVAVERPSRITGASVSTQIAVLRRMLFGHVGRRHLDVEDRFQNNSENDEIHAFEKIREGSMTLVVHVHNADIMATLLNLKHDFEESTGKTFHMTFAEATEAHLLAKEIAEANVSVVVSPSKPYPTTWDQRRILPGPPLSYDSSITKLMEHGVNVAIGVPDEYEARNTRFNIAWAALESHGRIGASQAVALVTTNLDRALGVKTDVLDDMVAYEGGDLFNFESKVKAVLSPRRRVVDLF